MGQVLESFTLTNDNEEVYFVATLDLEFGGGEGYCLTVGDGYTDGCTSFGHGASALILASETYKAVQNLSKFLVEQVKANPVDGISPTQHFWNLFCEEYEDGWLRYDAKFDLIVQSKEDDGDKSYPLLDFITKWRTTPTETKVEATQPQRYIQSLNRTLTYPYEIYKKALEEYHTLNENIQSISHPLAVVCDALQGFNYEVTDDNHHFDCNFGLLNVTIYQFSDKRKAVGSTFTVYGNPNSPQGEYFSYKELKEAVELIESEGL